MSDVKESIGTDLPQPTARVPDGMVLLVRPPLVAEEARPFWIHSAKELSQGA